MGSFRKAVSRVDSVISKINGALLVIDLVLIFILVFSNVIGRYFFSKSVIWVDELSRYLMIGLAFMGMGLAMRQSSHSSFTLLQNVLPDKLRKILRIAVFVIIIASMTGLVFLGWKYAMSSMKNLSEALRWPVGYWYLTIPAGSFLFIWHSLMVVKEYINQKRDAELEAEIDSSGELLKGSTILEEMGMEIKQEKQEKEVLR